MKTKLANFGKVCQFYGFNGKWGWDHSDKKNKKTQQYENVHTIDLRRMSEISHCQ